MDTDKTKGRSVRERLRRVIFGTDTPAGRGFDVILLCLIAASVLAVALESIPTLNGDLRRLLKAAEWAFTGLFLVEYALRLVCAVKPLGYATSFFGLVDLLAVAPSLIGFAIPGAPSLLTLRLLRLLRLFRVLKLTALMEQGQALLAALWASRRRIQVFLFAVVIITVIFGAFMYAIEGASNPGFDSIPRSVYWCVVTMTTVGYGDIAPKTPLGQFMASALMLLGYAIIAIPTGIVTAEMVRERRPKHGEEGACPRCAEPIPGPLARFCVRCGLKLVAGDGADDGGRGPRA